MFLLKIYESEKKTNERTKKQVTLVDSDLNRMIAVLVENGQVRQSTPQNFAMDVVSGLPKIIV
jgi:hypothetical protein